MSEAEKLREALTVCLQQLEIIEEATEIGGDIPTEAAIGINAVRAALKAVVTPETTLDAERLARALQATTHSTEARSLYGDHLIWAELGDATRTKRVREAERIAAEYDRLFERTEP